jgi:GT2 family glycosyltransferase
MTTIAVSVVLYNSARDVEGCLVALKGQTRPPDVVIVVDNASADDGLVRARRTLPDARCVRLPENVGFAAGHNLAIRSVAADVHIVLNPDCRLAPAFIERVVRVLEEDGAAGSVTGRLLRFRRSDDPGPFVELPDDRLDSTGMIALRNRRVLDRGTDEVAWGRYLSPGYVFGASGAAAVYRRAMLEDVAFEGQFFDPDFFAYREDVDLAWRAQLLGWRCRYEPAALARHRRYVAPGRRGSLPSRINRMSVANRWRLIAKNEVPLGWRLDWRHIVVRDVAILGYSALFEQRTLLAVADVVRGAERLRRWRRDLMRRRRVSDEAIVAWFGRTAQLPLDGSDLDGERGAGSWLAEGA